MYDAGYITYIMKEVGVIYSKDELKQELFKFLNRFGKQISALYNTRDSTWSEDKELQDSPMWQAMSEMYDYGVQGIPSRDLSGSRITGAHANVEMFLRGMNTMAMQIYLHAYENAPPRLAMHTVEIAVARMVLDGGERYSEYGTDTHGIGKGDWGYLTLAEVALLANMDERSVRNAANPKLTDHLKTEQVGKRSLVSPEEARRWLAGRKGFTPTKQYEGDPPVKPQEFNMDIPLEMAELIEREAKKAGIPFNVCLERAILKAYERIKK